MRQLKNAATAVVILAVWACLIGFAWFGPDQDISMSERRPLAQKPDITTENVLNGKFMTSFEDYATDQFPMRDKFRSLKSLFHYYVLNQKDNNEIYMTNGYAAKLNYPINQGSVDFAINKFNFLYDTYLKDSNSKIYMSIVPDKGYYLAEKNGYLSMDYEAFFESFRTGIPWATHVDITDCLTASDYYRTDTHWRQEKILDVAGRISEAMGMTAPQSNEFTPTRIEKPFYGVYYGQAALPMNSEDMYVMNSERLDQCKVFSYETNKYSPVYNLEKLNARDQYDIFLSGTQPLLRIENPAAKTDRELIVFRDSFGSSLAPLLVQDYKTVTLVDIRYVNSGFLGQFLDFNGQDVLFLYSTLILNNSTSMK